MHWGSHDFEYIRPVHWLVALLDDEVVNMSFLDVEAVAFHVDIVS